MAGRQIQGQGGRKHRLLTAHDLAGIVGGQGGGGNVDPSLFATAAQGAKADSAIQSVVAGSNVTVDNTDPHNPKVSSTGGTNLTEGTPVSSPDTGGLITVPGKITKYLKVTIGTDTFLIPAYTYLGENVFTSLPTYIGVLGPVAYWQMQETSGTTLTDSVGGEVLTLSGSYTLGSTPLVTSDPRKSILFSGGMATGTAAPKWALGGGDCSGVIVSRWTSTSLATFFSIRDSSSTNILTIVSCNRNSLGDVNTENWDFVSHRANKSGSYNNNTVHTLGFNLVSSTRTLSLWLDGINVNSVTCNLGQPTVSTMLVHIASNFGSQNLSGNVQDFALFNRALTATEHLNIANIVANGHT